MQLGLPRGVLLLAPQYTKWLRETLSGYTKAEKGRQKKIWKEIKPLVQQMQQTLDEYAAAAGPGSVLMEHQVWREIQDTVKEAPWRMLEGLASHV